MPKRKSGTREWSTRSQNIHKIKHRHSDRATSGGCPHNCRYCYARAMMVRRGWITPEDWADPRRWELDMAECERSRRHCNGVTMFPTQHDIWPPLASGAAELGNEYVRNGSMLLVVSKPHVEVIEQLTHAWNTPQHRGLIQFRFTITTLDTDLASFWEPGAPRIAERLEAARLAHDAGFRTSFSIEPMLDVTTTPRLLELLHGISPGGELWVGLMRRANQRVIVDDDATSAALATVLHDQTFTNVQRMAGRIEAMPDVRGAVRWKDSIQEMMGYDEPDTFVTKGVTR